MITEKEKIIERVYRCKVCGNIVQMNHLGGGTLVCCGEPMELLKEKTKEEGKEKHLPVVEKTSKGIKVKIGSIPHPMEEKHYIEWIEVISDGKSYKQFLKPGMKPEAEFCLEKVDKARAYCNVHGLWST